MKGQEKTIDFGAPDAFGAHVFVVKIPATKDGSVHIIEDFGLKGGEGGLPYDETRVVLPRLAWSAISDTARFDFNERLKAQKLSTGRWKAGKTKLDRLLGKELCVLAWAAERAGENEFPVISSKWSALRPEERWWLFSMTVAEAGLAEDYERGWRRALFYALSDGKAPRRTPRKKHVKEDAQPSQLYLGSGE